MSQAPASRAGPHDRHGAPAERHAGSAETPREADVAAMAAHLRLSATRLARLLRRQGDTGLSPEPAVGARLHRAPRPADPRRARRPRAGGAAQRHQGRRQARGARGWSCAMPTPRPAGRHGCRPPRPAHALLAEVRHRKDLWLASRLADLDPDRRAPPGRRALDVIDELHLGRSRREAASAPPAARHVRSLQHRNFRLFFTGQLISQVGNWLTLVAQTLLVLQLTDSGVALGVLAAAQFGPMLAARSVGRAGRRPLRQAQAAAHRADAGHGAVVRAGRAGVQRRARRSARSTPSPSSAA